MQTVLKAKGLVDVENGCCIQDPFVIIKDGRISNLGQKDRLPLLDPAAHIIEMPDQYLLPGLINSHGHASFASDGKPIDALVHASNEVLALMAAKNVRQELQSGVTTFKDCGARPGVMGELRRAAEMGLVNGPALFLSDCCLTTTGGHGAAFGKEVDGTDAMMRSVRERHKVGADFIKIIATGGGTPRTCPGAASLSVAEIRAATETAHRINLKVAAHCRGIPGIENAIAGGVDHIEHACFELPDGRLQFDQRLVDEIAVKGIYVTPTIRLYRDMVEAIEKRKKEGPVLPQLAERMEILPYSVEEKLKSLGSFLKAGVKCVAGNDAGLPYTGFGRLWQELEMMVEGGMTPVQAIRAATLTAAEAMGRANQLGSITVGKRADIIAVRSDPTVDITTLAQISFGMRDGRIFCEKGTGTGSTHGYVTWLHGHDLLLPMKGGSK